MQQKTKSLIKAILQHLDIGIAKYSTIQKLRENYISDADIKMIFSLPTGHREELFKYIRRSKSQFRQDIFVLSQTEFKKHGYFVEFGAADGIVNSNTYMLEVEMDWKGILAEPARCWHSDLRSNRSAKIETDCVWSESNSKLTFDEVANGELSTISSFSSKDGHKEFRKSSNSYQVNTISLNDLLDKYNAPAEIDYLSIDTEGSEFEILRNFDFEKYRFKVITCEHNHTPKRQDVFELLSDNGYTRVHQELSGVDDWYIRAN